VLSLLLLLLLSPLPTEMPLRVSTLAIQSHALHSGVRSGSVCVVAVLVAVVVVLVLLLSLAAVAVPLIAV
jgi:hypothetical protein